MKRITAIAAAAAAVSGANAAVLTTIDASTLEHKHLLVAADGTTTEVTQTGQLGANTVFANMEQNAAGDFSAFAASTGALGFEDYNTDLGAGTVTVENQDFRFVGGASLDSDPANMGGIVDFQFFDAASTFVDSFSVNFTNPGNFIYTITVTGPIVLPDNGILQLVADDGSVNAADASTGQWFLADQGPTIGSQDDAVGSNNGGFTHRFEIDGIFTAVPEPASAALLGLGSLLIVRRRR